MFLGMGGTNCPNSRKELYFSNTHANLIEQMAQMEKAHKQGQMFESTISALYDSTFPSTAPFLSLFLSFVSVSKELSGCAESLQTLFRYYSCHTSSQAQANLSVFLLHSSKM